MVNIRKLIMGVAILMAAVFISGPAWTNNIAVSNVKRSGQVPGSHWMVMFNIAWTNSWCSGPTEQPNNWDAAWVFIKWRTNNPSAGITSDWHHASLSTNVADHVIPAGSTIKVGLDGRTSAWGTNGVGAFIYRNASGSGAFTANKVQLRWNYAADGVADSTPVEVKVFALEMVYVPEGAFYLGTTNGGTEIDRFYAGGHSTNTPFLITNENQLTIGNVDGQLYYTNVYSSGDQTGIVSNAFPKGYSAFYGMKYEITQYQYVDFINMLTRNQQTNRFVSTTVGNFMDNIASNSPSCRNGVQLISDPGGTNPRLYANNLNTNDVVNAYDDGQWIACNYMSWADVAAYLDWAGLRPMTELEYVKACRGTNAPVANECAWGSGAITQAMGIANSGQANESPSNATANCVENNNANVPGPMRVGCMGIGMGTRVRAGAGYYGMMNMSDNVCERLVTTGITLGRVFTGQHGDGLLNSSGDANQVAWPTSVGYGTGLSSGDWRGGPTMMYIASRYLSAFLATGRGMFYGGRGVRMAP